MAIVDKEGWDKCVAANTDPYGNAAIMVARRAMEILDNELGDFDCHTLICRADDESKAGGITGFMAGCVANIISKVHSRGEEFRNKWNSDHGVSKKKSNGGVVNPAILTIG